MKKLAAILCLSALSTGAFAQGLINFFNSGTTLVSSGQTASSATAIPGVAGTFYFALLTAPTNSSTFTFANVYGTNQAVAGRFTGGANIAVSGWAAGTTMQFEVAGWSSDLGTTFNSSWLTSHPSTGFFGVSSVASGASGGFNGTGTLPNLNIFGSTAIASGFALTGVPEPSSMALAGLGAAALLIFRRRK